MNRTAYFLTIMTTVTLFLFSCQKDPLEEVNNGDWNHERNIINIRFKGQIGDATVIRNENDAGIEFTYNTATSTDYRAIEIDELEISYGAAASVKKGESLNFENADRQATVTVTPVHGEPLNWVITLVPFTESLLGEWNISKLVVFGGTGPEYGGAVVLNMTDKPWCWSSTYGPKAEQNNTLTFELTGITEEGNPYGTVVNNAGTDGLYADFIFHISDSLIDVNNYYRKIPAGTGTWLRDYSAGTVTFTFESGATTTATLRLAGTYDQGWGMTKTVLNHSFEFALEGTDDWNNIYTDYDKFVKRPRKYWVDLNRSK